jgi:hypothetical protein
LICNPFGVKRPSGRALPRRGCIPQHRVVTLCVYGETITVPMKGEFAAFVVIKEN